MLNDVEFSSHCDNVTRVIVLLGWLVDFCSKCWFYDFESFCFKRRTEACSVVSGLSQLVNTNSKKEKTL
jgi:hypothetical protein